MMVVMSHFPQFNGGQTEVDRRDQNSNSSHQILNLQVSDGINTAAMKFDRGHPFLTNWIYEVPAKYRADDRSCIGPSLVTPMLMHYCQGE